MTADWKSQLALLRGRVTRINHKYREPLKPLRYAAEAILPGREMENEYGRYFLSEKLFPAHRRHGSVELSRLAELSAELPAQISHNQIAPCLPRRWAFLDTETTGLAGGTGTCAFLVGVGALEETGFRVRLFFMRDYEEERAMLAGLSEWLGNFQLLITYNGKAYDAPLLDTRYRLARLPSPLQHLAHLDLLFAARRLWRLRLQTCRLVELEKEILGVEREGDLPGEMIPYYYFEYLRTREAFRLVPLFHHNVMDILSLAALTAVVLPVFSAPETAPLRHGEDLLGLARWLRRNESQPEALALYRRAVQEGLADQNLFPALWEIGQIEKKLGRLDQAIAGWRDLAQTKNPFQLQALEELAKHYEHSERNYPKALEMVEAALAVEKLPDFERRRRRLERKTASQARRLL